MYAVKLTGTLRVSAAGELDGLDLHEHGMLAYPESPVHPSPRLMHITPKHASETSAPVQTPVQSRI
jgi:hypothetical protein